MKVQIEFELFKKLLLYFFVDKKELEKDIRNELSIKLEKLNARQEYKKKLDNLKKP